MVRRNDEDTHSQTGSLLKEKRFQLKYARRPDTDGAVLSTTVGAAGGLAGGIAVVTASAMGFIDRMSSQHPELKKQLDKIIDESKELEKSGAKTLPANFERSIDTLTEDIIRVVEKEANHPTAIKNAGSWVTGLTALGAGLGYLWHKKQQNHKVETLEKEIDKLELIHEGWKERVGASETKCTEPSR